MIEHCTYCGKEHETGDLPLLYGEIPVKECPETIGEPVSIWPGTSQMLISYHRLGYADAIHQPPKTVVFSWQRILPFFFS